MKLRIHPLFFAVIIFCAFFGGLPMTLIYVSTALLHECGHIFYAEKLGFKCEKISLMPYGAAAVCNIDGISVWDEVKLALAGPLVNLAIVVAVAGLWWFVPDAYAYTDTVMFASLSMLIVNLLPAYPLDGGRIARCLLVAFFGERVALIALKAVAAAVAAVMVVLFFVCGYNVTLLIFALFLICSAIEKTPKAVRINFSSKDKLKRGLEVKYVLCSSSLTYKEAIKKLDDKRYLVLQLYDGGIADEITQDELYERAASHGIYDKVFSDDDGFFSKNERENNPLLTLPESTARTQSTPSETEPSTAEAKTE